MSHKTTLVAILLGTVFAGRVSACELNAESVGKIIGVKAKSTSDGVVRVVWPRTDVPVDVDGMRLLSFAGLSSWAAFQTSEHSALLMGDTVVFQDEVNPAIDAALAAGIEITGLHNHFFFDEPKVYFLHIGGEGCPDKLSQGVKSIWDAIKAVRSVRPRPATSFQGASPCEVCLNAATLEEIIEHPSESQNGIVKFTIARNTSMHGLKVSGSMGVTTWAAFSGTDDVAAIDGDFAMSADEIQCVLRSLRRGKLNIVALHNHMIGEEPAFYFVHFWGMGRASDLAIAFKDTLAEQSKNSRTDPSTPMPEQERHIRELETQYEQAVLKGDVTFFERILAQEFTHTSQNGKVRNRSEWLANHKQGESPYKSLNTDELGVRVSGHTAIVTGKISPTGTSSSGKTIEGQYRFLRVWSNHDGRWQVAAFQSTRVTP